MGNACAPSYIREKTEDELKSTDTEKKEESLEESTQPDEKFTKMIHNYQAELIAMKARMEEKDRALVKHRLEAALYTKASWMANSETVTKLLKAGTIEKFRKNSKFKTRTKWVEIHLHSAQNTPEEIIKGYLMLTYSDSQSSQLSKRCQILRVKEEVNVAAKLKGRAFSLEVRKSGKDKETVFACDDEKTRDE